MSSRPSRESPAVRIDADNEWAWCGARRLTLTPRAFSVLRHLVEHPGRLITKDDLLSTVWRDTIVSDAALASCIRDLRKALSDSSDAPRYIETVHRRGFRFIGPTVTPTAGASARSSTASDPASAVAAYDLGRAPETLVGREAELAHLQACLDRAMNGRRQLVFVTGEPGIGKTALVDAFRGRIAEARARIGHGQCVEQYGAGEAYLQLLEALGRLGRLAGGDALVHTLKQYAPTWLVQLPGLLSDGDVDAVRRRAQGASRDRMLRELVEALDALTIEAPLVLVLEDLHWSDSATIDLLGMLARRREAARLLVVGTYRPADIAPGAHPLKALKQELQVHGQCEEIALGFLGPAAVREYLAVRFADHEFPPELAALLHRTTDGNALFLVTTVDYLIARGRLREVDGQWRLWGSVDTIALGAPETLWEMVDKYVERLTVDDQAMLAVASVAGAEFSSAVAGAAGIDPKDAERRCEMLARRGQFLRAVGFAEWPDGTVSGRYAFIHALYQHVLYARIAAGARVGLHLRTGERLERGYGHRASEIAGELAMHFDHGRDFERAARYHAQAGQHALRQHAYREATHHATRGLELLGALPDSPARVPQELGLQVMLGAALSATRGYAAPEVARAYARARELCMQAGDTAQLFPILLGLGRFYLVRAEFGTARDVGRHLLTVAEATGDAALLLAAHNALGVVGFYTGDLQPALDHLERGIALYDPAKHSPTLSAAFPLGQDPGVSCTTHSAMTLWMLGYPARAAARMQEALLLARSVGHPFSLSYACHFGAGVYQWRGEREIVRELEDAARPVDAEHGFELFLAAGVVQRGWLLRDSSEHAQGLVQMREAIARLQAIGADVLAPAFLPLVAELHGAIGQPAEALSAVEEAMAAVRRSGSHYWAADLHRLKGVFTLRASGAAGAKEAEASLLDAIEIARQQGARSLELRAATSLGRHWVDAGKASEARALLSDIYGWFSEGFDTADLREAKALLDEIDGRVSLNAARRQSPPSPPPTS